MRIPLTHYAKREIALFGGLGLLATLVTVAACGPLWYLAAIPLAVTVWVFSFFRDPQRRVPQGERLLVSPADGHITAVETIDAPPELGVQGQALRISIFLSVFNCHLNRSPCEARVERIVYKQGRYLNALRESSAAENEQNILVLRAAAVDAPILVRQVSGAIARRIVCEAAEGDTLAAGQRFGMIKFGSRTDLVVPVTTPVDVAVRVGDRVKAGLTVLGQFT
ncbi:MAG TPA: phosphatidylserine decarboxylase [Phycisphaerae bacterium]|nr:phosphatidylserine decarboxylase [Phycisphaerae bacterium]